MNSEKKKILKYLNVEKNKIYAKEPVSITINLNEMKAGDDELVDISEVNSDKEELVGSVRIPGIFTINAENNITIDMYFSFHLNLIISETINKEDDLVTYYYNPGDLICYETTKSNATNIMILDTLFENRVKYLNGDLPKHVMAIYDQIVNTNNIKIHHITTLLTVLYGEVTSEGFTPVRLTKSQKYSKNNAINTKTSAHKLNSDIGFGYGYTNESVAENISRKYVPTKTDIEKVINGEFDDL